MNVLAEERANGTYLTHNSTSMGTVSLRYQRELTRDSFSVLGYDTQEGFHSAFTSVTNNRNTERITYLQSVPSHGVGGAVYWRHHESRWDLLAGTDADRVGGTSTDHLIPTGLRVGGGHQWQQGVFGQANATVGPARLFGGVRQSSSGGNRFLSPSAGVVVGQKSLRLRSSVYRAYRSATLNELYREFRVGNTATLPNANLQPETVFGAEAGADWIGESSSLRFTAYRNSLDHLITNVTLSSSPTAIVRQRQNAASAVSRGVEAEFHQRLHAWDAELKYLFVDSRYVTGYRVAQIPKHQGSAQLSYQRAGTLATLGLRSYHYQFDDDLNVFRLPGYAHHATGGTAAPDQVAFRGSGGRKWPRARLLHSLHANPHHGSTAAVEGRIEVGREVQLDGNESIRKVPGRSQPERGHRRHTGRLSSLMDGLGEKGAETALAARQVERAADSVPPGRLRNGVCVPLAAGSGGRQPRGATVRPGSLGGTVRRI